MKRYACLTPCMALVAAACGDATDSLPDRAVYASGATEPLACLPNLDGRIDADEVPTALDIPVKYRVSPADEDRAVDVTGEVDADGIRAWNWSEDDPTDERLEVTATSLAGRWFAGHFPDGELVLPFDAGGTLQGIYRRTATALAILGLVSTEPDPPEGRTRIVYDAPVVLLRFPLEPGAAWTSVGEVTHAVVQGLPYAGRDTYESRVDAAGRLRLPDFTFAQAHRLRLHLTAEPALGPGRSVHQVSFMFECFGEVARATSHDNVSDEDFALAAEVRRLGL